MYIVDYAKLHTTITYIHQNLKVKSFVSVHAIVLVVIIFTITTMIDSQYKKREEKITVVLPRASIVQLMHAICCPSH